MNERVTVTLPEEMIRAIARHEHNRSKFILQAVRNELERRRMEELYRSIRNPHPDSRHVAEAGFSEWIGALSEDDQDLVDSNAGEHVRWVTGEGWKKGE
jgi:hypothetical protein